MSFRKSRKILNNYSLQFGLKYDLKMRIPIIASVVKVRNNSFLNTVSLHIICLRLTNNNGWYNCYCNVVIVLLSGNGIV